MLRRRLALRGAVAAVLIALVAVLTVAGSAGAFDTAPRVTAFLPAAAGPVRADIPVRFRGVRVGELASSEATVDGVDLTLRLEPGKMARVPAEVRIRVLPRTLFGDQFLELRLPPDAAPEPAIEAGARIQPDTSGRTVRLYDAYNRLYQMISALHPAQLQVALDAVAGALRGKGAELGATIERAAKFFKDAEPVLATLGADLRTVAALGEDLAGAAPDLLASMRDAVALSETVVAERGAIRDLLSAGTAFTEQSRRMIAANGRRVITLVHAADPLTGVLAAHPHAPSTSLDAAGNFLNAAERAFSTGKFKIDAALSLDNPYPYTAADCPRYPGMAGPNCGAAAPQRQDQMPRSRQAEAPGGTVGPVGGAQEDRTLRELAPLLPEPESEKDVELLGLLLGPILRGQEVTVP